MMQYLTITLFTILIQVTQCFAEDISQINDQDDKVSYSLGYQIGGDFKRQGVSMKADLVVKGIEDALSGNAPLMASEEMRATLIALKTRIEKLEWAERQKLLEANLAKGEAFLTENSKKEGVKTLASGLQYQIQESGNGIIPGSLDTVTVNYRGTLIDGSEFDSSYRRNQPATFRVDQVIPAWIEALQLMKEGGKWRLFVPPELAYGERSTSKIPPNSTLIFDIELLSVGLGDEG